MKRAEIEVGKLYVYVHGNRKARRFGSSPTRPCIRISEDVGWVQTVDGIEREVEWEDDNHVPHKNPNIAIAIQDQYGEWTPTTARSTQIIEVTPQRLESIESRFDRVRKQEEESRRRKLRSDAFIEELRSHYDIVAVSVDDAEDDESLDISVDSWNEKGRVSMSFDTFRKALDQAVRVGASRMESK